MKIAIITTDNREQHSRYDVENPYFGTAPTALLEGFQHFVEVEVHVISCSKRKMNAPAKLAENIYFHQPVVPHLGWGRSLFVGCVLAVRRLLKKIKPDLVHGQGTERDCAISAVFSGFPNVLTIHGNMRAMARRTELSRNLYYKMAAFLEKFAVRRTEGVVCVSSYTKELVVDIAKRCWLIPNAVEQRFFERDSSIPKVKTMLFVGSLVSHKNPKFFVESCGDLFEKNEWQLRLCGTGDECSSYYEGLVKMADKLPWLILTGWRSREELLDEMRHASALVLPTLEDNCPMVVIEAMAQGVPVVASNIGGVPDLVDDGISGLLFEPSSRRSMRRAVQKLMDNCDLRVMLGHNGREVASAKFSPKNVAMQHIEIYKNLKASE